jgi:hypothetical protein
MAEITDCGVKGRRSSGCGDSGNTIVASKELVQWGFTTVKVKWKVSWCMGLVYGVGVWGMGMGWVWVKE